MGLGRAFGGSILLALLASAVFGQGQMLPYPGNSNMDVYRQLNSGPMDPSAVLNGGPYRAGRPAVVPAGYVNADGTINTAAAPMDPNAMAAASGSGCQPSCCCCADMFEHRTGVFAEYLYLRAFGADVAHGIQQNGVGGLGTVPAGDVGVATPEFDDGFRVGFDWALCDCAAITATYTQYVSDTTNSLEAAPGIGGTAASLVLHPGTVTAASTFSSLSAVYDINFNLADVDYSVLLTACDNYAVNYNVGVRYGHLSQDFQQFGAFAGGAGEEQTTTKIDFDGVGLRTGFDGQWRIRNGRWAVYGKGFIDILFGEFDSRYQQFNATTSTVEAASHWSDDRVLPILEYELGLKWTSCSGHLMASTGYYTAFWYNTVATPDFIRAVQTGDYTHVNRTVDFTGLTSRLEYRF